MPAEVETGVESEGRVQVLSGLTGEEEVVTSAQFLIDSEARLASAVSAMMRGADAQAGPAAEEPGDVPATGVKAQRIDVPAVDRDGDGFVFQCERTPHLLADTAAGVTGCPSAPQRVSIGTAQAVLTMEGYTNVPVDPARSDRDGDGIVYQSPMHWSVIHDVDGRCDICGMYLEEVTVAEARDNLQREGYRLK